MVKQVESRVIYTYTPGGIGVYTNSFDFTFSNISFIPDYMVIKSITVFNNGAVTNAVILRSNLFNSYLPMLAINITNSYTMGLNIRYPMNKSINGTYTFEFIDITTGGLIVNLPLFGLAINVEFVKE